MTYTNLSSVLVGGKYDFLYGDADKNRRGCAKQK